MTTDRELLEAAAKAAGIAIEFYGEMPWLASGKRPWNPLTDDGDALRLAVKLGIGILHRASGIEAHAFGSHLIICNEECAEGLDYNAATRRAIVRAAAEIGRSKT